MAESKRRTVVVTGCSSGIGQALVTILAKDGWTVFAGVRKEADANRVQSIHTNIRPLFLDVTDPSQVEKAFEDVRVAVGEHGLDALVNNAGVGALGPSEFMPMPNVMQQFEINYFGVVRVTQAGMPLLRMGKPGRVVIVGSIADDLNRPHASAYCASKSAVTSFTAVLRREVGRWGIKVALIKPGPVKSNFHNTAFALLDELQNKYPAGSACHKYYGEELKRLPKALEPFQKSGAPPSKAATTIAGFLNARWTRNVYYDTWGTYFTLTFVQILPACLYEYLMRKIFYVK